MKLVPAAVLLTFALLNAYAEPVTLTLSQAVRLALAQNRALKIARLKVQEKEQKRAGARADYFPRIKNESSFLHTTSLENIEIPRGAFGVISNVGPVPSANVLINQGNQTFETIGTGAAQPLTPLIRIRQANRIASSDVAVSRDDVKKAESEIALKVHEVYFGLLIAKLQRRAAEQDDAYSREHLTEAQQEVRNGNALKVSVLDSEAGLLQSEQSLLTIDLHLADLNSELNDLLGLPLDTTLTLEPVVTNSPVERPREEALRLAFAENPDLAAAMESVQQAKAAVTAAKSAYIPDISIFARQSYQNGVPFLVHNFGTFGVTMSYDVFDFGKRRSALGERETQLAQAQENVRRLRDAVAVQIEQNANKVERTKRMIQVASEVVKLRTENERIVQNQFAHGAVLASSRLQASSANYKAQAGLLQAQLAYMLAQAQLEQTIGLTPGR